MRWAHGAWGCGSKGYSRVDEAERWLQEIYSSRWTARFRRYCAEKFSRFTDPDQLMEDARQHLALSLQRTRERGADTPLSDGYIMVAFRNAVTDQHRRQSGRAEPRAWLKAFGRLGQRLFELYCLARYGRAEVIAALESDPELKRQSLTPQQASELMNEMDQRGECEGKSYREESLFNEAGHALEVPDYASPEQALIEAQSQALQAYLFGSQGADYSEIRHLVHRIQDASGQLPERLELDDDQRFILQATLSGQLTEAEMGALLNGLSVRQVRYKRQKALEKMKMRLEKLGLGLDELLGGDSAIFGQQGRSEPLSETSGD